MESEEPSAAKPQKPSVPITIDVESDDEPGAKVAATAAAEPEKPPPEKKTPKVIPVDEDEDEEGEKDKKGAEQSPVEEKASPRKRKAPEVIALDEDDDDERVVAGKVEGEGDKKGDGLPEVVSEVKESDASVEAGKVDAPEAGAAVEEDVVQKSPEKVEEDIADVDCDSKVEETPTEKESVAEPSVEKQLLVQTTENTEESSGQENKPEPIPEEQQISAGDQSPKATASSDDCDLKEVESAELDKDVLTEKTDEAAAEEEKPVEVEPAQTSAEQLEKPDSTEELGETVTTDTCNEEKAKSPEPLTKREDPEERKSATEPSESTETEKPIDLDDDVEMVEAEKVKVSEKDAEPAKPAATVDDDDDDVVMVSVEAKSSDPAKVETCEVGSEPPVEEISEKKVDGTAEPVKTEQDDDDDVVEVVEPKPDKSEEKTAETEVKKESSDDCKKEESVEPTEATEVAKVEADSTKSEDQQKVEETPSEKLQNPDEKSDAKKIFELDEKSGEFLERDTKPEEAVPQLITGDSDEEVVMVENEAAKAAGKPDPKAEAVATKPPAKPLKEVVSVECINPECKHETKEMAPAANFVLNFLGLPKKAKKQRICVTCFDGIKEKYEVCFRVCFEFRKS